MQHAQPALNSDWLLVDQAMVDRFASAIEDFQFIHVDPERAKETPFGGTIAHGFLTLSLLSAMAYQMPSIEGAVMGVNYGFNKIRFVSPVRSGARIRGRFTLAELTQIRPGEVQFMMQVTVEIEGQNKPVLVAEWLSRRYFEGETA